MTTKKGLHPCQSCGACCASFRVTFKKSELLALINSGNRNIQESVVDQGGEWVALSGTEAKHKPACHNLIGRIGISVACDIYNDRPSPCREFKASFEDGVHYPRCDQARAKHGLSPLHPKDWQKDLTESELS